LGLSLFNRQGKSLVSLTPAGEEVLIRARKVLNEINNITEISKDLRKVTQGRLNIATTHTQSRYVLPPIIKSLHVHYPDIKVNLIQGTSIQNLKSVREGDADFTILSGNIAEDKQLVKINCFKWQRFIVVPKNHPFATQRM